jgi:hypothetical protein
VYVAKSARSSITRVFMLLALSVVLASCGGGSNLDVTTNQGGGAASGGAAPAAIPTGRLTVTVTDEDGAPLSSAKVSVTDNVKNPLVRLFTFNSVSDQNGMASFDSVQEVAKVCVDHPLVMGAYCNDHVDVRPGATTAVSMVIKPFSPVTVALHPVTISAGSISGDRTELDLHVSMVASVMAPFVPSSFGQYSTWPPTESWAPWMSLEDCTVWLDSRYVTPACRHSPGERVKVSDYAYDPVGTPAPPTAQGPYSALLLLDQSHRAANYDPYGLRNRAAKHFIQRARSGPQSDLIAVAGFAGASGDASWPPLLQQLPLWAPPNTTSVFSTNRLGQEAAVDTLRSLVGGSAPVFDSLRAAMTLTATQAPATGRRAIVALLGGGDDSGLSEPQRLAALASLHQQQADTGIQVILISFRLATDSVERTNLEELAASLRAQIIYAGFPADSWARGDGLYSALDLAADILAGSALPTVKAVFRMKSDQPVGFQPGSTLRGMIQVESGAWDWDQGSVMLPLQFAVDIP